ncbi:MAG: NADH-quinone oxidoreductase subunit C [Acidobacteria bacterium]|nr:NADH-quinone oxidoreductase subunit C [Acidobacteriota bacterium]
MDAPAIIDALSALVADTAFEPGSSVDCPVIYVPADRLVATCTALRDSQSFRFEVLVEVTAADYFPRDPRFEIVYNLLSVSRRERLRLKVRATAATAVPTVQGVWASAGWLEREVWDMFGVVFDGHPDLRRLLMPEDWEGHPQRKDYPVQIKKTVQTYEPLQVTEEEFRANLERDRVKRTH